MSDLALARRFLIAIEPLGTFHWFSPEWKSHMEAAGLPDYARQYFCSRSAPLGPVPAEVVMALFFNWNPALVRAAIDWSVPPARVLEANAGGVRAASERVLGARVAEADVVRATQALREAVQSCPLEGRGLFAGFASLPWPEDPAVALWHAATCLREFRGDTHVAVLVSHGLGPIEAIVLNAAWIGANLERYVGSRMWSLEDAGPALDSLRARAFLDENHAITDGGGKFREMIEIDTDRRALAPVEALGADRAEDVLSILEPLARVVLETPKAVPSIIGRVGRAATG